MRATPGWLATSLAALTFVLGCRPESDHIVDGMQAMSFAGAEWSAPVNIGAPINTSGGETNASLSSDDLSLYFTALDRPGGFGGNDIWVSRRACHDCPWEMPLNLGPLVNGPGAEAGPRLSVDGHLFFFQSDRPGGQGAADIYVAWRDDPKDDLGWGDPINLGTGVNTAAAEQAAAYVQSAEDGSGNLYFNRGTANAQDLYYAAVTRTGETRGPAVLVPELSDPTAQDQHASVRKDGREIFFASTRGGGSGGLDLWTAARRSMHEPWSAPVNLGGLLNTTANDQQPSLSSSGRTLVFSSNRPGGVGGNDLWISTRTPSGHEP